MSVEAVDLAAIAVTGGGASYLATIIANRTDIAWLKSQMVRMDKAITSAHERVDEIWKHLGDVRGTRR